MEVGAPEGADTWKKLPLTSETARGTAAETAAVKKIVMRNEDGEKEVVKNEKKKMNNNSR